MALTFAIVFVYYSTSVFGSLVGQVCAVNHIRVNSLLAVLLSKWI